MDFSYSEDQQSLRELARKILEGESTHERLVAVEDTDERVDRDLWRELAKANLLGVPIAEDYGGSGLGISDVCILLEEVGRVAAAVPAYPTLVLGALPVGEFGSEEQRKKLLPRVVAGEIILSASLTEQGAVTTTARHDGTGWRVSGQRPLVPAAHVAHRILVPAHTEEDGLGVFLVDPATDGVEIVTVESISKERLSTLSLRNVRVPEGEVLGDPKRGAEIVAWITERATLALCALALGGSDRALEMTASYTSERRQFDRPVGSFQAVHQRAGDAYVDLQAMKLTYWRAMHLLEHGEEVADALAVAKYWAAEGSARITYAAQHLHGGIGVDTDYPLHRYYLWAAQLGIQLGSASEQIAALGTRLAR
jgi:alkylation response protein AidB-like acyl-CoA dehydrogenase